MLANLQNQYDDYKCALATLRKLTDQNNMGVGFLIDEITGDSMQLVVPRSALIDLVYNMVFDYKNQLANAYRAEATALEEEPV